MGELRTETVDTLRGLASAEPSVVECLMGALRENLEDSGLDRRTHGLVRLAALIALDAPPPAYLRHVAAARDAGVTPEEILGALVAVGPLVGVPTVAASVLAWQRSQPHDVPVGFLNDILFINNASCGFYPHVVRSRDAMERVLPRPVAFWLAGFIMLARMPLMEVELALGDRTRRLLTPAIWVGLGRNSLRLPRPGDAVHEGAVVAEAAGAALPGEQHHADPAAPQQLQHRLERAAGGVAGMGEVQVGGGVLSRGHLPRVSN